MCKVQFWTRSITQGVINLPLIWNNLDVEKECPTLSWAREALDPFKWKYLVKKTKYETKKKHPDTLASRQ
jgi:hypothetical protein